MLHVLRYITCRARAVELKDGITQTNIICSADSSDTWHFDVQTE